MTTELKETCSKCGAAEGIYRIVGSLRKPLCSPATYACLWGGGNYCKPCLQELIKILRDYGMKIKRWEKNENVEV